MAKGASDHGGALAERLHHLGDQIHGLAEQAAVLDVSVRGASSQASTLVLGVTVLVLAVFIGYQVVWSVTPALHSPLMALTNALSSVIIIGGILAAAAPQGGMSLWLGCGAIFLASINIFGGFLVTQRMLGMFKKRKPS